MLRGACIPRGWHIRTILEGPWFQEAWLTDMAGTFTGSSETSFGRGLNSLRVRFTIMIGFCCALTGTLSYVWFGMHGHPIGHALSLEGALLLGLAIIFSCGLTYFMTGKLTRPIENLKASTEAIAKGDFETAVSVDCHCEVGGLADSFRKMVARLNDNVAKINSLAYEDGVTGLPNRAVLEEVMKDFRKVGGYVLFIDLDRFKQVNDIYGHQVGDALLRHASQRMLREGFSVNAETLRSCFTANPATGRPETCRLLFRFAGDEFVALVGGVADESGVKAVAEALIRALSTPFVVGDRRIQIGASIGIVAAGEGTDDPLDLIKYADLALFEAKKNGRGRYAIFDEKMRRGTLDQLELEEDFARAIGNGEIIVHYQPKFTVKDGALCGLEALVRWQHPKRGLLYPGSFLQIANATGNMGSIGREVMACAAYDIGRLRAAGFTGRISINVCPTQFADEAFADNLIRYTGMLGASATDFELEVTETIAMTDVARAHEHMARLKAQGFEVSIDDFGTGYSNLAQLTKLPYDCLKIDRSLVMDITRDQNAITIVMAVVNMAHGLGHQVVVEGVEDQQQLDLLRIAGCDIVQGYHTGRPMELAKLLDVVRADAGRARPQVLALSA